MAAPGRGSHPTALDRDATFQPVVLDMTVREQLSKISKGKDQVPSRLHQGPLLIQASGHPFIVGVGEANQVVRRGPDPGIAGGPAPPLGIGSSEPCSNSPGT